MALTVATIDDSRTIREMMKFILKGAGYDVIEATDGKEALEVLETKKADIIMTDLNMPHMNGLDLIKELRKNPTYAKTPILVMTTESDQQKKSLGKDVGASGWIVKPFTPEKLLVVLQKLNA